MPLPRDYVQGIDCQRNDFEVGGRSYLHGRWAPRGWWYYYLVGLGIKTPLGTLAALVLVLLVTVAELVRVRARTEDGVPRPATQASSLDGLGRPSSLDELFLLAPALAILALVSSQTGFSLHVRYAMPVLPFLFIWCGKLAHTNPKRERGAFVGNAVRPRLRFGLLSLCLAATVVESLAVYPDSISFFNLLVGGPAHGHEWLLDSNGAWGQDLVYLKEWIERHPEARPLHLAAVGFLDPQALGIDYAIPPVGASQPVPVEDRAYSSRHAPRDVPAVPPKRAGAREPFPLSLRERDGVRAGNALSAPTRAERNARKPLSAHAAQQPLAVSADDEDGAIPQTWSDVRSLDDLGPRPGWYITDVNHLHGTSWPANRRGWLFQKIADEDLNYEYFRRFAPIDRIAYSYLVYHLTLDDANRVRRELNLPTLPATHDE